MMSIKGLKNGAYQCDYASDEKNKNVICTHIQRKDSNNSIIIITKEGTNNLASSANKPIAQEANKVEREQWGNQCEFMLSTVGYAVGLGNVWRFPYLVYKNGGGSFLIPYLIMLLVAGLPLFFLELVLGQYSKQGPIKVFGRIAPIFKGVGLAMLGATFFTSIYYNVIIAWTLFYMFKGFTSDLPWTSCTNHSSLHCVENFTSGGAFEVGPSEDFFLSQMLGMDKEIHDWNNVGNPNWEMVFCLFGAWIIVCLCLIKGVKSSGKVVYFTAIFPFVVLIILFVYGLTSLEGANKGIEFYITPDFDKLKDINIWIDASIQIFYSLGVAFGSLTTLSSYNKFNNNCHRDAIIVSVINCGTSVFAGFVIFSILGFMAEKSGKDVQDVVKSGTALAFVAYPEAVAEMPISPLWSFLFFFMLLTLGLDSMFAMVETITTAIIDQFSLGQKKHYVVIGTCFVCFLCGLSMCTSAGLYMFDLLNETGASWNLIICALLEVVIVSWFYGVNSFCDNIKEMQMKIPKVVEYYWKACWSFITPLVLIFLLIMKFVNHEPFKSGEYIYPNGIQVLGWLISTSSIVLIPIVGFYQIVNRHYNGENLGWALFKPTSKWGPPERVQQ